jgi:tRNA-Thr(GGU) m(6)t(6)A37 methyltransferase TsaA
VTFQLNAIGRVSSRLTNRAVAPKQGREGGPQAWLEFDSWVAPGLADLVVGAEIIVLTWLHQSDRTVLAVHPQDNPANPLTGVFSTRSADRPNPIGLHRVPVVAIEGTRVLVANLEAVDGTPIVDVKPALGER